MKLEQGYLYRELIFILSIQNESFITSNIFTNVEEDFKVNSFMTESLSYRNQSNDLLCIDFALALVSI